MEREYITVDETARLAGVKPRTVRSWYRKGLLTKYTTSTGWVRLDKAEVKRFLAVTEAPAVTGAAS